MATISGFLNELANGGPIRQKWDNGDRAGAMDDFGLSADQKDLINKAVSTGNLQKVKKKCEEELHDGQTHFALWVK